MFVIGPNTMYSSAKSQRPPLFVINDNLILCQSLNVWAEIVDILSNINDVYV